MKADPEPLVLQALAPMRVGPAWRFAVALCLAAVGWAGFAWAWQIRGGLGVAGIGRPVSWGLYIASFVFWIGLSHSGTLISAILRLAGAWWRHPITRAAEALTVFSLVVAAMFPLIHLGRVWLFWYLIPIPNQRGLWPDFRSPLLWDATAIATYLLGSSLFLLLPMIPDLAALRDRVGGWRRGLYGLLSRGWNGTLPRWRALEQASRIMTILILPVAVSVHTIVSWDFAMTLVPGWHSTVFGPYFVAGAIYSGVAAVISCVVLLRRLPGFSAHVTRHHLDALGRILLAVALVWTYLLATETLTLHWTGEPTEIPVLRSKIAGEWAPAFWAMVILNGVVPILYLSFRRLRRWVPGLLAVSLAVNAGMYLERVLIVVPSLARSGPPDAWGGYRPTWVEISIVLGSLAGFLLLYLLFVKVVPLLPLWEVREGRRSRSMRTDGRWARDSVLPEPEPELQGEPAEPAPEGLRPARVLAGLALGVGAAALAGLAARGGPREGAAVLVVFFGLLSAGAGAILLLSVLRLTGPPWHLPASRAAELAGLAAAGAALLFPAAHRARSELLALLPPEPLQNWPNFRGDPAGALALDLAALAAVVLPCLLALLPGLAGRDRLSIPPAAALLLIVPGLTVLGWDLGMTLAPHWRSTLFGFQFTVEALLSGTAATLLVLAGLRRTPRGRRWLGWLQVDQLGILLLVFALLAAYAAFAEILTVWYGRIPSEYGDALLRYGARRPGALAAVIAARWLAPVLWCGVPRLRRCIPGTTAVAALVLAGGVVEWALAFEPGLAAPGALPLDLGALAVPFLAAGLLAGAAAAALRGVAPVSAARIRELLDSRGVRPVGKVRRVTYALREPLDG